MFYLSTKIGSCEMTQVKFRAMFADLMYHHVPWRDNMKLNRCIWRSFVRVLEAVFMLITPPIQKVSNTCLPWLPECCHECIDRVPLHPLQLPQVVNRTSSNHNVIKFCQQSNEHTQSGKCWLDSGWQCVGLLSYISCCCFLSPAMFKLMAFE